MCILFSSLGWRYALFFLSCDSPAHALVSPWCACRQCPIAIGREAGQMLSHWMVNSGVCSAPECPSALPFPDYHPPGAFMLVSKFFKYLYACVYKHSFHLGTGFRGYVIEFSSTVFGFFNINNYPSPPWEAYFCHTHKSWNVVLIIFFFKESI